MQYELIGKPQGMDNACIAPNFFVNCYPSGRSEHVHLHPTFYAAPGDLLSSGHDAEQQIPRAATAEWLNVSDLYAARGMTVFKG